MRRWLAFAFIIRICLMLYGAWQDTNVTVKYTDVDYFVFNDAADFVIKGDSPYTRATYRYTPILAWILTLNSLVSSECGKVIFIIFDVLVGKIIYSILRKSGHHYLTARNCALVWLLNLLPGTVSSRGNAEAIMAYLVLMSLAFLIEGKTKLAAVFYSLSIHFKIYPVTFAVPIYLYLGTDNYGSSTTESPPKAAFNFWSFLSMLLPNRQRCTFISISVITLGSLTWIFYYWYGWVFLYETYLYHIVRGDIKHNFSPYFYLLYLTSDPAAGVPLCLRLLVFLPQAALLLSVAFSYYHDQPFCWFLCTFIFVMANKVCTSQYFLWYLSLLPLILPKLRISLQKSIGLVLLWFLGQVMWLLPAYYLEFEGKNTFLFIWAAGLLFFCINAFIVHGILSAYKTKVKKN